MSNLTDSWPDSSAAGLRILVADDDAVNRRLLERTLMRLGHHVEGVADGNAAIARLLERDAPRFAILDWMMPGADGLMVCRSIRERLAHYVYVIVLTAKDRREDMVAALDAGVDDFLTKPFDLVELRARLQSGARVVRLQEHLLEAQAQLRHQATHDQLTGLWNRAKLFERLTEELARTARFQSPLAIALADLDHFKQINDGCGHLAGDTVLQQAAARIRSSLRDVDAVGRYGGEEFLVLLPGCDEAAGRAAAERIREAFVTDPIQVDRLPHTPTISVGVACSHDGRERPAALIEAADRALYAAKRRGRNRVEIASEATR